ncbi:MAG: sigma-70 family RNA polymerase sigma factor [Planctomycetes bacterium]|nr:sigma-70 family RNA polymerase sigma factor [Planctomycetota bacterium]
MTKDATGSIEPSDDPGRDVRPEDGEIFISGDRDPRSGETPNEIETMVEQHLAPLTAFVRLRAGGAIRAKESISDLVQSTCREILTHADRLRERDAASFRAWLYTTAERKVKDRVRYWRAQRRDVAREATPHTDDEASRLLDCYQTLATPSRDVGLAEELARVERAMAELSEEQREVVTLYHLVGLSHAEIATHLGKSEVAVRKTLSRALAKLSLSL